MLLACEFSFRCAAHDRQVMSMVGTAVLEIRFIDCVTAVMPGMSRIPERRRSLGSLPAFPPSRRAAVVITELYVVVLC